MKKQKKLEMRRRRERIDKLKEELRDIKEQDTKVEQELDVHKHESQIIDAKLKAELSNFAIYTEILEEIDEDGKQEAPDIIDGDGSSDGDGKKAQQLKSKMRQI